MSIGLIPILAESELKMMNKARKLGIFTEIKKNLTLYLMILPVFIGFVIFRYLPMSGIILAFKDYDIIKGISGSPWVGFKWFQYFFEDPYFVRLIRNTIMLNIYGFIFGFWPPIMLAILLNEVRHRRFKKIVQSISYLPHFIATIVIVGVMIEMLGTYGIVNDLIERMGFERVSFLSSPSYFRGIYVGSGIWQGVGWSSILYLATISGIDPELYLAASIDGAGRLGRIAYITIPGLMPTIRLLFIFEVSAMISVGFEKAYLLQNPSIYETADVISTYVYRMGIQQMDMSYGTAIGLFEGVIAALLLMSANYLVKKTSGEDGLW